MYFIYDFIFMVIIFTPNFLTFIFLIIYDLDNSENKKSTYVDFFLDIILSCLIHLQL